MAINVWPPTRLKFIMKNIFLWFSFPRIFIYKRTDRKIGPSVQLVSSAKKNKTQMMIQKKAAIYELKKKKQR